MINKFKFYSKKMLSYCLKCRKNTESKNPKVVKTKNGRIILSSKFAVYHSKKSKFNKGQEAKYKLNRKEVLVSKDLTD